ncbi:RDH16-like protein [Mya arenaria]|uniref:RDH16-like protein n=1 Tax=Mya arenaria TaxID=6604 RepID=A0ABY7E3U7_MYAAR|nr:RDH16-like protein [Mya arenaria]
MKVFAGCLTEQGAIDLRALTSSRLKTVVIDITVKETVIKALKFVQENLDENGIGHHIKEVQRFETSAAISQEIIHRQDDQFVQFIGLWGVVNNAGVMPTFAPVEWTSVEEFQHVYNVNFFGSVFVTQKFLPMLRKSRGRLVNVCSVTSHCAYPGITTYVTSKAALKMFTVCLSQVWEFSCTKFKGHHIKEVQRFETSAAISQEIIHRQDDQFVQFIGDNVDNNTGQLFLETPVVTFDPPQYC